MSKQLDKISKTPVQDTAYKLSKNELQQKLTVLAKQTVNSAVESSKTFRGLSVLKAVPMAWMKQRFYRRGWEEVVGKYLVAPKTPVGENSVTNLAVKVGVTGAVGGMALGAMAGFALVGGTVAIAPVIAGAIVAGLMGGGSGLFVASRSKELNAAFAQGKKGAEGSKGVNKLAIEKVAIEKAAQIEIERQKQADEEISKLHAKAEQQMKRNGAGSFVENENAKKERLDEEHALTAA